MGFSAASLLLLVIWPLVSGYWELYYALMPFPWSTLPFQLAITGKSYGSLLPGWMGIDGVTLLIWAYMIYQAIVLTGTVILGRKWQCSMICLMNGCHAESLGIGLPFIVHDKKRPYSKQIKPVLRRVLRFLQGALFTVNILLALFWTVHLFAGQSLIPENFLIRIELIKYVSLELTLMMFLWLIIGGRGYCYYCPAGFGLAFIARLSGQRIETGLTYCTQCGACNDACKMSIDIMTRAKNRQPVLDLSCVGCGLCMDSCPTSNLLYRTYLFKGFKRMANPSANGKTV
ncbi:MAG: 4Fe-4S binding protein [Spirochaetales bacterium]|nr:4Fe-4S binding protein [Spirochaetales bacterium]